jgi:methionyl-tRNA formyltransferase
MMRTLLVGGTDLAVAIAAEMHRSGFSPCAIVGIGRQFKISYAKAPVQNARHGDVGLWAHQHNIPYLESTESKAIGAFAAEHRAEFCLVAGWYHKVPRWLRERFSRGTAALHASLLPQLRGGAPLNWAILSGLSRTGISLFELGDGIDDGPVYMQAPVAIGPRTTIGELVADVEEATLRLIRHALPLIDSGDLTTSPQVGQATYGMQRVPEDGRIDWRQNAEQIDRLIRAVSRPYPGAFTDLDTETIRIWKAHPAATPLVFGIPGQIACVPDHPTPSVVTADGLLILTEVTLANGGDAMPLLLASNNKRLAQA